MAYCSLRGTNVCSTGISPLLARFPRSQSIIEISFQNRSAYKNTVFLVKRLTNLFPITPSASIFLENVFPQPTALGSGEGADGHIGATVPPDSPALSHREWIAITKLITISTRYINRRCMKFSLTGTLTYALAITAFLLLSSTTYMFLHKRQQGTISWIRSPSSLWLTVALLLILRHVMKCDATR